MKSKVYFSFLQEFFFFVAMLSLSLSLSLFSFHSIIMRCLRRPEEGMAAVAGALAVAAVVCVIVVVEGIEVAVELAAAALAGAATAAVALPPPFSLASSAAAISALAVASEELEEEGEEELASLSVSRSSLPSLAAFRTSDHSTTPLVPAGIAPAELPDTLLLPPFCCWLFEAGSDSEETREGSGGKGKAASAFF